MPKEIRFEDGKPIEGIAGDWSFSPSTPTLPILTGQGAFPESPYQDSALSRVFAPQQIAPFDGAAVHSVDDTDSHSDKHFAHKDRSFSDHFVTADSQITDESSDEDYETRSMAELENDEKYKERKPREIQVKQELTELQNTISSQLDSARKTMIPAKTKVQTAKIGTQSSGYFQQIIPCLQTASGSDVQRFEDPSLDIIEDIEKQPFGSGLTDGTGEMLLKSIMNRAGSGKWKDQVYLTVKDEEVFVCFPEKLQAQVYGE